MNEKELQLLKEFLFKAGENEDHRKGSILIQEGATSNRFYYLKKGLLRGWTNNDGKEVTFQFLFEDHVFCSAESFFYNTPCSYSIETIEDSLLLSVDKTQMDVLQKDPVFLHLFNQYLISRVAAYQQLLISRVRDKPEARYKKLLQENPEMLLRIPQHYIASYLGITPVSLSRIRNR